MDQFSRWYLIAPRWFAIAQNVRCQVLESKYLHQRRERNRNIELMEKNIRF